MTIVDRLLNEINLLDEDSQMRKIYLDINANIFATCDSVAKQTCNRMCNLIERIEFDVEFLWDECRSITFYTRLDNYEKKFLFRFDLWRTHYEFQYLYF